MFKKFNYFFALSFFFEKKNKEKKKNSGSYKIFSISFSTTKIQCFQSINRPKAIITFNHIMEKKHFLG